MGTAGANSRSVLLVDDSPVVQGAMKMVLEWEGYQVACAANGREALDYLQGFKKPCVILLDLDMPVMDGWQLREELKQDPNLASIPVVTVSAMRDPMLRDSAGCVEKPFVPEELLQAIRQAVVGNVTQT